jgi:hypothetical protein
MFFCKNFLRERRKADIRLLVKPVLAPIVSCALTGTFIFFAEIEECRKGTLGTCARSVWDKSLLHWAGRGVEL